jgi:hypothetical protein
MELPWSDPGSNPLGDIQQYMKREFTLDHDHVHVKPPVYDREEGNLILEQYADGAARAQLEVRKELEEAATLDAVITELERRGYSVLPPRKPDWRECILCGNRMDGHAAGHKHKAAES